MEDYEIEDLYEDDFEERVRTPEGKALPVIPLEARNGPWTGNNQLGITQEFAPDATNRQTILKLDEWGMPEVWTVMLGIEYPDDEMESLEGMFELTAIIAVGVGGTTQLIEVDWKVGTVFSAPMNSIDVVAVYNAGEVDPKIPDDLRLTVTLARGTALHPSPTYTLPDHAFVTLPAGDNTDFFKVPPFATHIRIIERDGAGEDLWDDLKTASFFGYKGAVSSFVGRTTIADPSIYEGIPIPAHAKYVAFTNDAAGADCKFLFQFVIGL